MSGITIFHNPNCSTSRKVLAEIRDAGFQPQVVDYLKTGWTRAQLEGLLAKMGGARPRDILRLKGDLPAERGLDNPAATDAAILDAMVAHPVLVERPIVERGAKAVLARPPELWRDVLLT